VTPQAPDSRSAAEKDVDRIAYSSAFRRLSGVTQVVAVGENMLLHNRLTHTLKVGQLSRRIAQNLNRDPANAVGLGVIDGVDVDAAEAAGLAHDLGHPPFGHVAEKVLDGLCVDHGLDGFEGNAQSFRIVVKLSRQKRQGLSLSDRTLNGVLKYPWMSDAAKVTKTKRKWGAYATERDDFERVRGDLKPNQTIEAEVMDWADDISYAVHDLEDFFRAGFIELDRLSGSKPARQELVGRIMTAYPREVEAEISATLEFLLGDMIRSPGMKTGTDVHRDAVKRMGSILIDRYVRAASLDAAGQLSIGPDEKQEVFVLKQLTWFSVIQDPTLAGLQRGQEAVISSLFHDLHTWLGEKNEESRWPTRLQQTYVLAKSEDYVNEEARRARAVADFISSLTEGQSRDLYARLRGGTAFSIQDRWLAS
jgi:dGTPase